MKMKPEVNGKPPGPKAKAWLKRNSEVLAGTEMSYAPGLITAHGEGCFVNDPDGNVFLDLCQSRATEGHSNPKIIDYIKKYMDKNGLTGGIYTTTTLGSMAKLSETLLKMMPGKLSNMGKVAYCNSGSESCDYALSIARMATNRKLVIAFKGAYHGITGSAMMASSWKAIQKRHYTPLITDTHIVPYAYCYRCSFNQKYPSCNFTCLEYIRRLLDDTFYPEDVAALIVEPMLGHAGFVTPPAGYFEEMRKLCNEIGALLIVDEVYTGFGKTGKIFAIEHWDAEPDIVAVGKPFGAAGFNLAAVVGSKEMMDNTWLINAGAFSSGASPLACAAAIKKIELMYGENWPENAENVGNYFLMRLGEMYEKYPIIGDVRGRGLLIGVEFVKDRETKEPAYKEAIEIRNELFNRGVVVSIGGTKVNPTFKISTALVITEDIAEEGLQIFEGVLKDYMT
jgi:4-aminobutyrate aminotransferase-like enzyme